MDHLKVFSAFGSILLCLLALFVIHNLPDRKRSPLLRFAWWLAVAHLAYEVFCFGVLYTDVNIHSVIQSSLTFSYKAIWFVIAAILFLIRVLLIKIGEVLLGKKLPINLWRWSGALLGGLFVFVLAWAVRPEFSAHFHLAAGVFRVSLVCIEVITMAVVLWGSRSCLDPLRQAAMRSFAFLNLVGSCFFVLQWTVYRGPVEAFFPRFILDCLYPISWNAVLPVWFWFFLRPWVTQTSLQKNIAGATGNLGALGLSAREQEILSLMLMGKSNKDIAGQILVSEHTVKNSITGIYTKLSVANRKELFHRFLSGEPRPE